MRIWLILWTALCAASTPGWADSLEEVRLLRSDSEGLEALVILPDPEVRPAEGQPGYHVVSLGAIPNQGEPGQPRLPRVSFWVAVPPGATAAVNAEGLDQLLWDRIRPLPCGRLDWVEGDPEGLPLQTETIEEDARVYGGSLFPASWAEVGPAATLRHLRVVPIVVAPVRWDPAGGELRIAREVHVEVRFVPGPVPENARPVLREDPSWERVYRSAVLNAEAGRGWAQGPVLAPRRARYFETRDLVKLEVKTSAVKKVTFADLEAIGWPGSGAALDELRLFERFHDSDDAAQPPLTETEVPILISDADGSESWSEGDAFYFYGQNFYERMPEAPDYLSRYGRRHVYWLGLRSLEPNARMESAGSWLDLTLAPVPSYPWTEHFEDEIDAYATSGAGVARTAYEIDDENNLIAGVASIRSKHAYWQGGTAFSGTAGIGWFSERFDLPGFLAPRDLTVQLQGIRRPTNSNEHVVHLYLSGTAETDTVPLPNTPVRYHHQYRALYTATAEDLAAMPLRESGNYLVHLEEAGADGAALDWFEVTYDRESRFVDGLCQIATENRSGPTAYELPFAPGEAIVGIEVTDPRAPRAVSIDEAVQIEQQGPFRTLTLQWELDGSERVFRLGGAESLGPPEEINLDTPSDLAAPGDHDYVVIIPRVWIPQIQPLIDHRQSSAGGGHRVLLAPIEDVYDEFSGGRRWSHAVRSFLRTLFRTRDVPPSFLLLVGDATNAFDNDLVHSAPNWVPTQTHFSNSYQSFYGPDLIASDQWFVDNLGGTGENLDFLPDMHIGRLSVGNTEELDAIVEKIIEYETFSDEDSWRNRILLVSDDAYSSQISFDAPYRYNRGEEIFRDSGRLAQGIVEEQGNLVDFGIDSFYVACYMDTVPSLGRCIIDPGTGRCLYESPCELGQYRSSGSIDYFGANLPYGEEVVAPKLWQAMSRGYLFVSFNGHSNARLMTHEFIFRHAPFGRLDVERLTNTGRPFVFMGYGCHLAEFSADNEGLVGKQDGISEELLFAAGAGGVASIASTAYEWLPHTHVYNSAVVEAFFENPPQHEGHTRWVLGEILTQSKANLLRRGNSDTYRSMSATYQMLGDPGLIMDAAPPRMRVTLDGEAIASGAVLSLPADRDSVLFEAQVRDEIWARSFSIEDAGGVVPPDRYTVTPDSADDRSMTIGYRTTILPRSYDIVLRAEDANGRISKATYTVLLDASFQVRHEGGDWIEISDGELVVEGDSLRVDVSLPRYLPADDIEFLVDSDALLVRAEAIGPEDQDRSTDWRLTSQQSIARQGSRRLVLRVQQPDQGPEELSVRIETDEVFDILQVYNVPNPFEKETWIFYRLGAPAEDVSVRIYTSSGKQIRSLSGLPSQPGLNEARWDGKDEDGDDVGNGLYFYKLFVAGGGDRVSRIEKMAKVR